MRRIPSRVGSGSGANDRWRGRRFWAAGLLCFLGAWLLWTGMSFAVSTRVYLIPSASMAPTIRPGDRVGVQIKVSEAPKRGEIWVFRMPPASGKAPNESIKRIIGLPGETVEVASGRVLIDGQPIAEPYLSTPIPYAMPALTLGRNEYFVLGDSRNASHDSHVWGPLPADHLIGQASLRYWPMTRIGGL